MPADDCIAITEYPSWSRPDFGPHPMIPQQGVCHDEEFSHDGGEGKLRRFSRVNELRVLRLQIGIEANRDEGGHVKRAPYPRAATLYSRRALPFSGLSRDRGQACECRDLLCLECALRSASWWLIGQMLANATTAEISRPRTVVANRPFLCTLEVRAVARPHTSRVETWTMLQCSIIGGHKHRRTSPGA